MRMKNRDNLLVLGLTFVFLSSCRVNYRFPENDVYVFERLKLPTPMAGYAYLFLKPGEIYEKYSVNMTSAESEFGKWERRGDTLFLFPRSELSYSDYSLREGIEKDFRDTILRLGIEEYLTGVLPEKEKENILRGQFFIIKKKVLEGCRNLYNYYKINGIPYVGTGDFPFLLHDHKSGRNLLRIIPEKN